jgi:phosphatidylserine/phosphatidylglycerophosphate/cardiolipin synthase-like enzyme
MVSRPRTNLSALPRILSALALAVLITACTPARKPEAPPVVRPPGEWVPPALVISAFHVAPIMRGGPEESVRIANLGDSPVDIAGYSLSDVFGPAAGRNYVERGEGTRRDIVFPAGTDRTVLQPGQEVTVARDAAAYYRQFGALPDFEMGEDRRFRANDPTVPDMIGVAGRETRRKGPSLWPNWPGNGADVIALFSPPDARGETRVVDVVVYDFNHRARDPLLQGELREYEEMHGLPPGTLWDGPPLDPWGELASPYGPRGRVFARDHDERGRILPDTNSFRDWNNASSRQQLGEDPTHRIKMPGQSRFLSRQRTERATITMTSAPDNNFQGLIDAWNRAEREILVSVYYFGCLDTMEPLVAAIHRGVDVTVWLEGTTVGVKHGFTDSQRYIMQQIEEAGRERSGDPTRGLGRVYWLRTDRELRIANRYIFDHSKYSIIDGRVFIVGSENYGSTGHPIDPTYGNRGWEIQIATPEGEAPLAIVRDALEVFHTDVDPENHRDVIRYNDRPENLDREGRGRYGPPPRGFDPSAHRKPPRGGNYVPIGPPQTITEEATFELVTSPDTSLNENTAILGAIANAKEELLVQHLDLRLYWGVHVRHHPRSPRTTPSLLLEAIIAAARRGVRVRVLLDCSMWGCQLVPEHQDSARDSNDDTVAWLRILAEREGLDLQAQLLDVLGPDDRPGEDREHAGLSKIHNKGLIVDGRTVLISSINGSENSFKGNREMAVLVTNESVASYYRHLFYYDWTTIAAPRDVATHPDAIPGGACSADLTRTGVMLTGLPPETDIYLRVTAFDSDDTNVDPLDPSIKYGPHESAFSLETRARTSPRGALGVSFEVNTSEKLEGDLAGYRIYWGIESGRRASTAEDAKKLGFYQGVSRTMGRSPITTTAGCPIGGVAQR